MSYLWGYSLVPTLPSSVMESSWVQFSAPLPGRVDTHPLGCHRARISDWVVPGQAHLGPGAGGGLREGRRFRLLSGHYPTQIQVSGSPRECSPALEQAALDAYDKIVGLGLEDLCVDGCIVKVPCGGQAARPSPVDLGKQGTKRSVMVEAHGIPVGVQVALANRHDSPLLAPTLECLGWFGFDLPEHITVHLDAGYDSRRTRELLEVLGCQARISPGTNPNNCGRTTSGKHQPLIVNTSYISR